MSAYEQIRARRQAGQIIVLDGAMGTELEARGAAMDDDAWCGLVNLTAPDLVRAVHCDHIRAGAEVVITNTFMSGLGPMTRAGAGDDFERGVRNALEQARAAIEVAAERPVAIAGSVGATQWGAPPVQPGRPPDVQLRDGYARQVQLLAEGGAELIALEMVTDLRLGQAAVLAALETGLPVWLGLSVKVPGSGSGAGDSDSLPEVESEGRAIAQACLDERLDAVCVMHTDIHDTDRALAMLEPLWSGPVGAYPHHGVWERPHWRFVDVAPDELVELADGWVSRGACMLGGCCGLTTRHVAALREYVDARAAP